MRLEDNFVSNEDGFLPPIMYYKAGHGLIELFGAAYNACKLAIARHKTGKRSAPVVEGQSLKTLVEGD